MLIQTLYRLSLFFILQNNRQPPKIIPRSFLPPPKLKTPRRVSLICASEGNFGCYTTSIPFGYIFLSVKSTSKAFRILTKVTFSHFLPTHKQTRHTDVCSFCTCASERIRTSVGILREVYSLLHLTALPPTHLLLLS